MALNKPVIEQWKLDLKDRAFPKFNMDYEIIEHAKREYEGDAALFLAYRYADKENLSVWYHRRRSYEIVTEFTGIPFAHAKALLNPPDGEGVDYTLIKPDHFIQVLDLYLETGMVTWPLTFLMKPQPTRRPKIVGATA